MIQQKLIRELAESWSALPNQQREQVSAGLVRLAQRRQQRRKQRDLCAPTDAKTLRKR